MLKFILVVGIFTSAFIILPSMSQDPKQSDSQEETPEIPDEITFESKVGDVVFPHLQHIEDEEMECSECHHQIHAKGLDTPHPEYFNESEMNCQTCHDSELEGKEMSYNCSDCHHSEPDNIADETLSSKVVVHKSCWDCHETGTGAEASDMCTECHVKKEK